MKKEQKEKVVCDNCEKEYEITPFSPLIENEKGEMVCLSCEN